jgi:phage baseplate assembly protein W
MGKINLQFLEKQSPHSVEDDLSPNIVSADHYTYKDIKLDLQVGDIHGNIPANLPLDNADFADLRDIDDLKQSLSNILNTKPGQKLLNPYFGLDLSNFCFEPITETTADLLARSIIRGLPMQEPRIQIEHLNVEGDIEQNTYTCTFTIKPVDSALNVMRISAVLGSDGFTIF